MIPPKRFIFCKPYKDCLVGETHIIEHPPTKKFSQKDPISYTANDGNHKILHATWDLKNLKELLDLKIIIPY